MNRSADIAIVGAGIVGLAHAYMALRQGHRVVLFERDEAAVGASIRNFGLIWPIGQAPGEGLDRALRSRVHWLQLANEAGFWINPSGSLHLAHHLDEEQVLHEFLDIYHDAAFDTEWLTPRQTIEKCGVVNPTHLRGSLWSATECTVNPREAVQKLPHYLSEKYGLILKFGHVVKAIALPRVETARETWQVQHIYVCSGADFETLYPQFFDRPDLTKCKLQMMKVIPDKPSVLGPALCAGLTLRHYAAFTECPSLVDLDKRYDTESLYWKEKGIHVLVSQNEKGEIILGDSHHYAKTHDPFLNSEVETYIESYLQRFVHLSYRISERWMGVYPKHHAGLDLVHEIEPGVVLVNGLGGAGMTLSFGLAEENVNRL